MLEDMQSHYLKQVLERFDMANCKPVTTPIDSQVCIVSNPDERCDMSLRETYQSAIGSLMYAMTCTRPDLCFAVGLMSRYCANPSQAHWTVVKRMLRYVQGTKDHRLCLGAPQVDGVPVAPSLVFGYCDADWAGDIESRKSTSGYVYFIGGGPVSWRSTRQECVALSTTEAEYIAISTAVQEALWFEELTALVGLDVHKPIRVYNDNQSALQLAHNPVHHSRTKHIAIRYHFIRDHIERGAIDLKYCATQDNAADVFTKALPKVKHVACMRMLALTPSHAE